MKQSKTLFSMALIIVCIAAGTYLLKNFSLTFVQVEEDRAVVTINFLFPMDQSAIDECIEIETQLKDTKHFSCSYRWLSKRTVQLIVEEKELLKGQKIRLWIQDIPTENHGILRNVVIPIQFKTPIHILEPTSELLISTEECFKVTFNTPIPKSELVKYLESEASFHIEMGQDPTTYYFTPKQRLENNKNYTVTFKKGIRAQSGEFLQEDQHVLVRTDEKPLITKLAPLNGSKWMGLFPRIVLTTNAPIKEVKVLLNEEVLVPYQIKEKQAIFYASKTLNPESQYEIKAQITSQSGEKSDLLKSSFTTTGVKPDRIWVEVSLSEGRNQLKVYQGEKLVRTFSCSGEIEPHLGTFYVDEKRETYLNEQTKEGSNSWMHLSEGIVIQGLPRDSYWQLKPGVANNIGKAQTKNKVILLEEDAMWLYRYLPLDTMVIIRP